MPGTRTDEALVRAIANFPRLPDEAVVRDDVAAAILDCHRGTVWSWIRRGRLAAVKVGPNATRIRVGSIRAVLRGAETGA